MDIELLVNRKNFVATKCNKNILRKYGICIMMYKVDIPINLIFVFKFSSVQVEYKNMKDNTFAFFVIF